jgi:hypothetical protein
MTLEEILKIFQTERPNCKTGAREHGGQRKALEQDLFKTGEFLGFFDFDRQAMRHDLNERRKKLGMPEVDYGPLPPKDSEKPLVEEPVPVECRLTEMDAATTRGTLIKMLTQELAYGDRYMPVDRATQYVDELLSRFGPNARFYTDSERPAEFLTSGSRGGMVHGYMPFTFEVAVHLIDDTRVAAIWVGDED